MNGGENVLDNIDLKKIKKTVQKQGISNQERKKFEQRILSLETENNRLRMQYENKFNSQTVKKNNELLNVGKDKEKEEFYQSQIEYLIGKQSELELEIKKYKKRKIPELHEMIKE